MSSNEGVQGTQTPLKRKKPQHKNFMRDMSELKNQIVRSIKDNLEIGTNLGQNGKN